LKFSDIINSRINEFKFDLNCKNAKIYRVESFGTTSNQLDNLNNIIYCTDISSQNNMIIEEKCDLTNLINEKAIKECTDKSSCNFNFDLSIIRKNCKYETSFDYFYLSYSCYSKISIDN